MKPQCPIKELVMVKYGGELNVSRNRQSKHKWDLGKCVLQVHLTGCVEGWKMEVEGKRDCRWFLCFGLDHWIYDKVIYWNGGKWRINRLEGRKWNSFLSLVALGISVHVLNHWMDSPCLRGMSRAGRVSTWESLTYKWLTSQRTHSWHHHLERL